MFLKVSEHFLDSLLYNQTKVLMGKILKRVEVFNNKEDLKNSLREIIPEWVRELKYHIVSFNSGLESFEFEFKQPKNKNLGL